MPTDDPSRSGDDHERVLRNDDQVAVTREIVRVEAAAAEEDERPGFSAVWKWRPSPGLIKAVGAGAAGVAMIGLLAWLGPNVVELYKRAAVYVDKIIKGAKPAELPVEQPKSFELVINLKTAKALGIKIPGGVLMRADQVIQKDTSN